MIPDVIWRLHAYFGFVRRHARLLGFGFLLTFFSSFGQTTFIGLFGAELRGEFGLSHSGFGLLYAAATVASGVSLIWLGRWIDRIDLRLYAVLVCLFMAASALGFALVASVAMLGVVLFTMRLSCQGLLTHTAVTAMARYFAADRGKAVSLAATGNTVGQGIFPALAVAVIALGGWRSTWFATALAGLVVLTPLALWLLRGHGERHRAHLAALNAPASNFAAAPVRSRTRRDMLRDPTFYRILPVLLSVPFITTGYFFHVGVLVAAKDWEMGWFASLYALYAAVTVGATLASGSLIDRMGASRMLIWFAWPLAAGLALLALSDHAAVAVGYMALIGFSVGANYTINGSIWAEIYGVAHLGAIRSLAAALMVFSTAAAPAVFGMLLDAGLSIEGIGLLCIAWIAAGSWLAIGVGRVR